jgi:hypothetical protein
VDSDCPETSAAFDGIVVKMGFALFRRFQSVFESASGKPIDTWLALATFSRTGSEPAQARVPNAITSALDLMGTTR